MKLFIEKFLVFSCVVCCLALATYTWEIEIISQKTQVFLPDSVEILISGHSHANVIIDTLIHNASNCAVGGEAYLYTYRKVEKLIADNPQIRTVLVEFTNNDIHADKDNWFFDDKFISNRIPIYSAYLQAEDYWLLLKKSPLSLLNSMLLTTSQNTKSILNNRYDFLDKKTGFNCSKQSILDKDTIPNRALVSSERLSLTSIKYLRKLIDHCKKKGLQIFLIRSPQHKQLGILKNESTYKQVLYKYFRDVELLDFNNLPLGDIDYEDYEHLNCNGATKYSRLIDKLIQEKHILTRDNKQDLIDIEIQSFGK